MKQACLRSDWIYIQPLSSLCTYGYLKRTFIQVAHGQYTRLNICTWIWNSDDIIDYLIHQFTQNLSPGGAAPLKRWRFKGADFGRSLTTTTVNIKNCDSVCVHLTSKLYNKF